MTAQSPETDLSTTGNKNRPREIVDALGQLSERDRIEIGYEYARECKVIACPWCGREIPIRDAKGQLLSLRRKDFEVCACCGSTDASACQTVLYRSYRIIADAERRFLAFCRADPTQSEALKYEERARRLQRYSQTLLERAAELKNKAGQATALRSNPPGPGVNPRDREVNAND